MKGRARRALVATAAVALVAGLQDRAPAAFPELVTIDGGRHAVAAGFAAGGGRVVTVAHALPGRTVVVRGGDGVARRATVVRRDEALDLALLDVPGLPRARRAAAGPGTRVLVRRGGTLRSLPATVRRRITARVRTAAGRLVARRPALELAGRVAAGDSGAPVVDERGRVAGIVFACSRARPGIAYAVDAAALVHLT